jgi:hypothetical protein
VLWRSGGSNCGSEFFHFPAAPPVRDMGLEDTMLRRSMICIAGVKAVLSLIDSLVPHATPRQKKRLANKILTLLDGTDRTVRITQDQARDLILPHLQCIKDNCPQLCFWEPISRTLNIFFNEEDQ